MTKRKADFYDDNYPTLPTTSAAASAYSGVFLPTLEDDLYRSESCFKNAICTISTNLSINLNKFVCHFGGQLTSSLPGVRFVCALENQRYTFIFYSTGNVVLTNFFFLTRVNEIFEFFAHLCFYMIAKKIATIGLPNIFGGSNKPDDEDSAAAAPQLAAKKLQIRFLIENIVLSFQICPVIFETRYDDNTLAELMNYIAEQMRKSGHILIEKSCDTEMPMRNDSKRAGFPARRIRIFYRRNLNMLTNFKSEASRKRNKDQFAVQKMSLLIFRNGKIICTGAQTREDLGRTAQAMRFFIQFFFESA